MMPAIRRENEALLKLVATLKAEVERITERNSFLENAAHANKLDHELFDKIKAENERLRAALLSLQGAFPPKVYIYGAYGDQWSADEPNTDEFEEIDFESLLNGRI